MLQLGPHSVPGNSAKAALNRHLAEQLPIIFRVLDEAKAHPE